MDTLRPNRRPTTPWATRSRPDSGRRQCGGRARSRAVRRTRSPGLARRGRQRDGGPRCRAVHVPTKPERTTDPASAPVGGHGPQFRCGMDQPELRVFSRVSPRWAVLPFHASMMRRAISYAFHPQRVSIQPSGKKAADSGARPIRDTLGEGPSMRTGATRHHREGAFGPCDRSGGTRQLAW